MPSRYSLVQKFRKWDCSIELEIEKLSNERLPRRFLATWPWVGRRTRVFSIVASSAFASHRRKVIRKLVK